MACARRAAAKKEKEKKTDRGKEKGKTGAMALTFEQDEERNYDNRQQQTGREKLRQCLLRE